MSTLWAPSTQKSTDQQAAVASSELGESSQEDVGITIFREIQAETKSDLAFINPEDLRSPTLLGNGSSFRVTREIFQPPGGAEYYVAVKRVVTRASSQDELQKRLSVFRRELRVLMHPPLRSHSCIIFVLGQGYMRDASQSVLPYLVMDYSDHGTLSQYLRRCNIPLDERRELALDVGVAIRSLHDCHIVHGDIKMENVLVFDSNDDFSVRPQMARLADFGSAIFEDDFTTRRNVQYLGTTKYNAPEIAARSGPGVKDVGSSFEMFKKADVYSFGLLLLEVTLNGTNFIDKEWLGLDTDVLRALNKDELTRKELLFLDGVTEFENGLLQLATEFADRLPPNESSEITHAVTKAMMPCLQDNALKRGSMAQVNMLLAQGTSEDRPRISRALPYISPPTVPSSSQVEIPPRKPGTYYRMLPPTSDNLIIRMIDPDDQNTPALTVQRSTYVSVEAVKAPVAYQQVDIDSLKASVTISPPWQVQCSIANQLRASLKDQREPQQRAHLHLQLAVMYHLGYGILPSPIETLQHLANAVEYNAIARCIYPRVLAAIMPNGVRAGSLHPVEPSVEYNSELTGECPTVGLVNFLKAGRKDRMVLRESLEYSNADLDNLTTACMHGNFELVKTLIPLCGDFPADYAPNPLHWLIMFSYHEATYLLHLLLAGTTGSTVEYHGICHAALNSSCEDMVNLPEYCMDLFGTPLHFAVRSGYLELVSAFLSYGADINKRWNGKLAFHSEARRVRYPTSSPLDVAVNYHFADIVHILLEHGAETFGGDIQWKQSPFHMIGQKTIAFARFVAHGSNARKAVIQTIRTLCNKGLDINAVDSEGRTPLRCAVGNLDLEQYILEELLEFGASAGESTPTNGGNIAILAAQCCNDRRFSTWKLNMLVSAVEDINQADAHGRNALHYCALFDAAEMARVLLAQADIDIDCKAIDDQQNTPLLYAAKHGAVEVAALLIEGDADIETTDARSLTPLNAAVNSRHVGVARLLLQAGASPNFLMKSGGEENILHVAVTNASQRPSVAKQILAILPINVIEATLGSFNAGGWTPLHVATYFGDIEGVTALLQAGADRDLFLHPQRDSVLSLGGTPLQLATRLIEREKQRSLGPDHEAIKREGPAAVASFMDRVEEIVRLLKKYRRK